jgi:muramoyltetrapeptide carboxypeptidase
MHNSKPKRLCPGDTIAFMATSSNLAADLLDRVHRAQSFLKSLGFRVRLGKTTYFRESYVAGTGKERADELHELFLDPEVKAVISYIGGNHSIHMLEHIDYNLIRNNPTILVGYSDTTVLELALYKKSGLITYSGPAVLTQFAEFPKPLDYTLKSFLKTLTISSEPIGDIPASEAWTQELHNWFDPALSSQPRKMNPNNGYVWLSEGNCRGKLVGGCITSLMHLKGTEYWPDFSNAIFFWETPESEDITRGESLENIDAYLYSLKCLKVFDQISGMIVGRPYGYSHSDMSMLHTLIREVTRQVKIPILAQVDFGHTDPMLTVPIGIEACLDSSSNTFSILEAGVS